MIQLGNFITGGIMQVSLKKTLIFLTNDLH